MARHIKLIVFDLGGVIFSNGKEAFIDLLAKDLQMNRGTVISAVDGTHGLAYRRNEISPEEYWSTVKEMLGIQTPSEELAKLWFDQYVPFPACQNSSHNSGSGTRSHIFPTIFQSASRTFKQNTDSSTGSTEELSHMKRMR